VATLTVWKFDTPGGAEQAFRVLTSLQSQELLKLHDAAWVEWQPGKNKPKTHQAASPAAGGAAMGALWGLLFGLIFFVPLLGAALGAAGGALGGALTDVGIDDRFIDEVRSQVTPGTSALFLLTSDVVVDKVREHFPGGHAQLVSSNLSSDQETKLREVFAEE
jgi:uncharacterized membrane protein